MPVVDAPPASLLDRLRDRPARAPETLALAAVEKLGPAVARRSGEDPAAVVAGAVRAARIEGAATGAAGALGIVPDLVALGWLQARMVLRVAHAHGFDPTQRTRAAELLVLWGFFDDVPAAARALEHEGSLLGLRLAKAARGRDKGVASRLVRIAGRQAAQRFGGRLVPGVGAFVGSIGNARATRELGERALRFYGG